MKLCLAVVSAVMTTTPALAQQQPPASQFVRVNAVENLHCYQKSAASIRNTSNRPIVATVSVTLQGNVPPAPPLTVTVGSNQSYNLGCTRDDRGGRATFTITEARYAD